MAGLFNEKQIAKELLQLYGSKTGVSHHRNELIQQYGRSVYERIMAYVKQLRYEKKNEISADVLEKTETLLKRMEQRFARGGRYAFIVIDKQQSPRFSRVKDCYGRWHPMILSSRFNVDDQISCLIVDHMVKLDKKGHPMVSLVLDSPQILPDGIDYLSYKPMLAPTYSQAPWELAQQLQGLDMHVCGKPFTCSCCGQVFPEKKGYKFDFKEIYLCTDCKKLAFPSEHRGWHGRIITTPMGNKR